MIARYDLNAGTIQGDFLHHQLLSRRTRPYHLCRLPWEICSHRSESGNELRSRLVFFRPILSVVGWLKGRPDSWTQQITDYLTRFFSTSAWLTRQNTKSSFPETWDGEGSRHETCRGASGILLLAVWWITEGHIYDVYTNLEVILISEWCQVIMIDDRPYELWYYQNLFFKFS